MDRNTLQGSAVCAASIMRNDRCLHSITSPSALAKLTDDISSQVIQVPIRKIGLRLLQPLSTESMLVDCRDHAESFRRNSYGSTAVRKDSVKVLSLKPLFEAWRAVWSNFPSDDVQLFVFNIDLPDSNIEDTCADSRIYWGHYVPETGGLAVTEGRVSQAILELATVMRVRSNGTAKFSLAGADNYRAMHPRSIPKNKDIFKGLEDVLEQLSTPEQLM